MLYPSPVQAPIRSTRSRTAIVSTKHINTNVEAHYQTGALVPLGTNPYWAAIPQPRRGELKAALSAWGRSFATRHPELYG